MKATGEEIRWLSFALIVTLCWVGAFALSEWESKELHRKLVACEALQ